MMMNIEYIFIIDTIILRTSYRHPLVSVSYSSSSPCALFAYVQSTSNSQVLYCIVLYVLKCDKRTHQYTITIQ